MLLKRFIGIMAVLTCFIGQAQAQSEAPRWELGGHLSVMRLSEFEKTDAGVGGRISFNLNRHVGLDAEFSYFPQTVNGARVPETSAPGVEGRVQGLFGVKAGQRGERFGLFGKLRPGFVRFLDNGPVVCPAVVPPPLSCGLAAGRTELALDYGGVAEIYTSRHTMIRLDLGDTLIRYSGGPYLRPNGKTNDDHLSHNLQLNIGFGLRF